MKRKSIYLLLAPLTVSLYLTGCSVQGTTEDTTTQTTETETAQEESQDENDEQSTTRNNSV